MGSASSWKRRTGGGFKERRSSEPIQSIPAKRLLEPMISEGLLPVFYALASLMDHLALRSIILGSEWL